MYKKIRICVMASLITFGSMNAMAAEDEGTPKLLGSTPVIEWESANSADELQINAVNSWFTIHFMVAADSPNSATFACGPFTPEVIAPGSGIVCFIDDGSTATWSSTNVAGAANGIYLLIS